MISFSREHFDMVVAAARQNAPNECCGLAGGNADGKVLSVYSLKNVAPNPRVNYETSPEDLFWAQRLMRERGEQLVAIYHSHPRSVEPTPSDTDVRLAYYPSVVYLIVGLAGAEPTVRAFHISEKAQTWEPVEYEIGDE
ncbi:MAG TPA: M67 family metallopeptidase [Pyrinomonadaceae bacterium]|nr:M67 family metallopeptidase [Pyrinomonadaceae bacterium]